MRISTIVILAFIATVVIPIAILLGDLLCQYHGWSMWWWRGFLSICVMGLVDTLLHVDSMIRRNVSIKEES